MSAMFPPDMMAALQGGAGPQPAAGGMPPDIAALLGGGGEEAAGPPLPSEGAPGGGGDSLEQAIAEEADQEDQNVMRQCSAKLQAILAKNQKEQDSMLSGSASPSGIRKVAAQGGGGEY